MRLALSESRFGCLWSSEEVDLAIGACVPLEPVCHWKRSAKVEVWVFSVGRFVPD